MHIIWSRWLRSAYRRDPAVSFVVTVAAVDALIGGLSEHWSLLAVGLTVLSGAVALRWWQVQRQPLSQIGRQPMHQLPPQASRPSLPTLSISQKKPPGGRR